MFNKQMRVTISAAKETSYPHLSEHFRDKILLEPRDAGQRACRQIRNTGVIPLSLEEAEKILANGDHEELKAFHVFEKEHVIVRQVHKGPSR